MALVSDSDIIKTSETWAQSLKILDTCVHMLVMNVFTVYVELLSSYFEMVLLQWFTAAAKSKLEKKLGFFSTSNNYK